MSNITDNPRILIVEDEKSIANILKIILLKEGYCVTDIVATGEEAIGIALDTRPDLILINIRLAGMLDGITTYEQIKKTVEIPVIFVSGYTDNRIIARSMQCKPIGYIVKPFKSAQIINEVQKALVSKNLYLNCEIIHASIS